MPKIDIHSDEWQAIEAFITEKREEAIKALIADDRSEQQRGILSILEQLSRLPSKPEQERSEHNLNINPYNL